MRLPSSSRKNVIVRIVSSWNAALNAPAATDCSAPAASPSFAGSLPASSCNRDVTSYLLSNSRRRLVVAQVVDVARDVAREVACRR